MIGPNSERFSFDVESVFVSAPNESGIYALFKEQVCVYVGESKDIQTRLFDHLKKDNECITRHAPNSFQFELSPENRRVERQNALIGALKPACNQKLG